MVGVGVGVGVGIGVGVGVGGLDVIGGETLEVGEGDGVKCLRGAALSLGVRKIAHAA